MENKSPTDEQLVLGEIRQHQKAEGAFIASAAGDALGWPQELPNKRAYPNETSSKTGFSNWLRWGGGRFYRHEQEIKAGEYSDDTQLMLAVARCRTFSPSSWWRAFTRTELPLWSLYERGGGVSTKRAARAWSLGVAPWEHTESDQVARYFNSGGNGVAMRVLPHSIYFGGKEDPSQLIDDIFLDGISTHGHPRALLGAAAYGFAAWWFIRSQKTIAFGELIDVLLTEVDVWGTLPNLPSSNLSWTEAATSQGDYRDQWSAALSEMLELLNSVQVALNDGAISNDEAVLRRIGAYGRTKGAGTITAAAALYLAARYAAQPSHGVVRAAFGDGTDTDTIAAMVGGLAGCMAGSEWIPQDWLAVQDIEYIRRLASLVAEGPDQQEFESQEPMLIGRRHLDSIRRILRNEEKTEFSLDGIRRAKVIAVSQPRSSSRSNSVRTWSLRIEDGQSIYVNIYSRTPRAPLPSELDVGVGSVTIEGLRTRPSSRVVGVKLTVRDLAKAAAFYTTVFGLHPTMVGSSAAIFGPLTLVSFDYAQNWPGDIIQKGDGSHRTLIHISVPSLDDVLDRVEVSGGTIREGVKAIEGMGRVFYCFDIDANPIEVIELE